MDQRSVPVFPDGVPDGNTVVYGPDIPDEESLRLLGTVEGRRILEMGIGTGRNAVALARQGAKVIAVDPDAGRIDRARALADRHDVKVEFHHADPAELAFIRADTVDLVLSVHSSANVDDTDRLFRQAHRVLRTEAPFVLSLPHPAWNLIDAQSADALRITHSWFDTTPRDGGTWQPSVHPVTFSDLFGSLYRAGFRMEVVLEPEPVTSGARSPWWNEAMRVLPATMVVRARKLGL